MKNLVKWLEHAKEEMESMKEQLTKEEKENDASYYEGRISQINDVLIYLTIKGER